MLARVQRKREREREGEGEGEGEREGEREREKEREGKRGKERARERERERERKTHIHTHKHTHTHTLSKWNSRAMVNGVSKYGVSIKKVCGERLDLEPILSHIGLQQIGSGSGNSHIGSVLISKQWKQKRKRKQLASKR